MIMAFTRPSVSLEQAFSLASKLFQFQTLNKLDVTELESYQDRNFLLKNGQIASQATHDDTAYVLKVFDPDTSRKIGLLDFISKVLLFLNDKGIRCPVPQLSISKKYITWCRFPEKGRLKTEAGDWTSEEAILDETELISYERCNNLDSHKSPEGLAVNSNHHHCDDDENTVVYAIVLFTFVPGKLLCDVKFNADVMWNLGLEIGKLHMVFKEFSETSDFLDTKLDASDNLFHMQNSPVAIIQFCHALEDEVRQALVQEIAQRFRDEYLPKLKQLDTQVIHGDLNEHNIIVDQYPDNQVKIKGFIDFGDVFLSHRVLDVGIAVAYIMIESINQGMGVNDASSHLVRGYQSIFPLSALEMDIVLETTKTRICQSLVMGAHAYKYAAPGNEYLLYTSKNGWKALDDLLQMPSQDVLSSWLPS